jgi:pyrroline-5-carboxylate reductase
MRIAFIGGGNMATAMIGGLFAANDVPSKLQVADPIPAVRQRLEERWPVSCYPRASEAIKGVDTIVLAVKPQSLPMVLDDIGEFISAAQLVISIVAGIPINQIATEIKSPAAIIRTMPNIPALIDQGITALYASEGCSPAQRQVAQKLMHSVGEVVWLEQESLLDVVTAVSGSGPAYFFYLIEAVRNAGTRLGLPADIAEKLALHTASGASAMALQSDMDVAELRHRVTSKGGTTQAALDKLREGDFEGLVDSAIAAATQRGQDLAGNHK